MRLLYKESGVKQTVSLFLDNTSRSKIKSFHCTGCGFVCFQYYNESLIAVAGEGPEEDNNNPVVVIQCGNNQCRMLYKIYRG